MSHLIAPKTLRERTGSVVGWYGLLAPEIMDVLEASPSKPSVSSVVLIVISGEAGPLAAELFTHSIKRGKTGGGDSTPGVYVAAQAVWRRTDFVSCRLEMDGENKPEGPLIIASSWGRCSGTRRAGKSKLQRFLLLAERAALIPWVTSSSPSVRLVRARLTIIQVTDNVPPISEKNIR